MMLAILGEKQEQNKKKKRHRATFSPLRRSAVLKAAREAGDSFAASV
jgi:hypothetical protein